MMAREKKTMSANDGAHVHGAESEAVLESALPAVDLDAVAGRLVLDPQQQCVLEVERLLISGVANAQELEHAGPHQAQHAPVHSFRA